MTQASSFMGNLLYGESLAAHQMAGSQNGAHLSNTYSAKGSSRAFREDLL